MRPGVEVEPFNITAVRREFVLGPSQGRFGDAKKGQIVNILVYNFQHTKNTRDTTSI